jgi:outer membrane biosynthesis protein TonB
MRKTSKRQAVTLLHLIALVVLVAYAPGWAKQSTSINLSEWECAKDYLQGQGKSVPVAYRNSSQISKSVEHSEPLEIPCCAQNLNIKGEVTLDVVIDPNGNLKCARGIKGNPIAITSAVASLPKWRFRIYRKGGKLSIVIGQLTLPYDFTKK